MTAYYNELDPYCAQWLRNLIDAGLIAPGDVDERSIADVQPGDVLGYEQCHWFAGIGGWSFALRLAGWPDSRPVWTGSCPCQPFSAAGKRDGAGDSRDLWPAWWRLIRECRPQQVFGEQVTGAVGHGWLDRVCAEMEPEGYAVGAVVLGAHSVGAPHIRHRLWWVADGDAAGRGEQWGSGLLDGERAPQWNHLDGCGTGGGVELASSYGWKQRRSEPSGRRAELRCGQGGGMGDSDEQASQGRGMQSGDQSSQRQARSPGTADGRMGKPAERGRAWERDQPAYGELVQTGPWRDATWLECADGKARRLEPGIEPLADGLPARASKLRALGNAIVPQVAAAFIGAYMECRP